MDHSSQVLQSRIDSNSIGDEETVSLKIPMSLPYPVADDYQFIKGNFEHNGEYYKLVKQKLNGDTLYVVCIKDKKAKNINIKMIEYGILSNDLQSQTKGPQLLLSKIIKDYTPGFDLAVIHQSGWVLETSNAEVHICIPRIDRIIQSPPPRFS